MDCAYYLKVTILYARYTNVAVKILDIIVIGDNIQANTEIGAISNINILNSFKLSSASFTFAPYQVKNNLSWDRIGLRKENLILILFAITLPKIISIINFIVYFLK